LNYEALSFLSEINEFLLRGNCKICPKKLLRAPQSVTMC